MTDRDFVHVVQEARASLLWRAAVRASAITRSAWQSSLVGHAWRRWSATIASWPVERRVRVVALTLAWAGVGHAVSTVVLPPYVASALPRAWTALFIVAALAVAAVPAVFVQAWKDKYGSKQQGGIEHRAL